MNPSLSKRIILSPTQLQRLLGRDRELTDRSGLERSSALQAATKAAAKIGPAQAYAQYQATQQRHINQAAHERGAPLELVVSEPTPPPPTPNQPEPKATTPPRQRTPKPVKVKRLKERRRGDAFATPGKPRAIVKPRTLGAPPHSPIKTRAAAKLSDKQTEIPWLRFGSPH